MFVISNINDNFKALSFLPRDSGLYKEKKIVSRNNKNFSFFRPHCSSRLKENKSSLTDIYHLILELPMTNKSSFYGQNKVSFSKYNATYLGMYCR